MPHTWSDGSTYEAVYPDLIRFVQRRAHPEHVEDVVADAFLVVWRRLDEAWKTSTMGIEQWWTKLQPSTQEWLIENNGDAVPADMVAEIASVGGPASADPWWADRIEEPGHYFPDEGIDWVEAVANEENPG